MKLGSTLLQQRRNGTRVHHLKQVLFAAILLIALLCWLVKENAPLHRFRRGLVSLRAHNAEEVSYSLLSLHQRPELEGQTGLLQGWLRLQAITHGDSNGVKDAVEELELAADNPQNRALALALIGQARYQQGRLYDALTLLSKSLEADPDEVEAHRWLGVAFYDIGNMASALPHLERVAAIETNNGRPHRLIGIIYRDFSDFERAAAAYEESLARDSCQADAEDIHVELARCQVALLKYDKALTTMRGCRDTAEVLTLRSQCYHAKGLIKEARRCVEQAVAIDPDYVDAIGMAATLASDAGDTRQAAELLSRAVDQQPNEYSLRYRLIQVYRRLGEFELANQQALGMDGLRQLHEDLDTLIKQANYDQGNAKIRYGIAALAEQLGMAEQAENWRKAAQMLDRERQPNN